ncbi:MAG: methionyl-tRNA formyltransferase [Minisyncoccia bacterium]|jgi:methionyl-tRNA formyltransferase
MKYIFFGTPHFAEIILDQLIKADMPPHGLVCNPDRPLGRKKIITPPPTKRLVATCGAATKVLQPEKLDEHFIDELKTLDADFFVVAAYAKIIPKAVLDVPRLGTIGVHPSLLPRYRGATPLQSVILNGETETGVTIYLMDEKMDHGPVLAQAKMAMNSLTASYRDLEERLAGAAAELLLRTMPDFYAGRCKPQPQDEDRATFTKKFTAEDGFVAADDLTAAEQGATPKAEFILRKINALTPEPGVWTTKDGKRIKLLEAELRDGALRLKRIQKEGGRPITP